ncbi:MAG: hypothetical protein ACI9TV_001707 [Sulfurimonas sp.]|jgi:hypothetical protein|uniref:hypothetical protein n=1 Tax=Sulfurimonas sp. TaxID=2022749 RepID=UPI0039E3077A
MHIKRLAIASLVYIAFIGWYMSTIVGDSTTSINVFGIVLPSLSNSVWVMLILLILAMGSILHVAFYSVVESLQLRKNEKDYAKMVESISDAYLGKENRSHIFKTPGYRMLGLLIDNSTVFPNNLNSLEIEDEKIRSTIKIIEDIKSGKAVDTKKLYLSIDNPLTIQNDRNAYRNESITAKDFLKNPEKYNAGLLSEIYIDYVKTASLSDIETYKSLMSKEALSNILSRVNAEENILETSNKSLISLFEELELDIQDYLDIAASMSSCMIPEQRMKLFEKISDEKEEAMDSYLFTLFDLEMIAPADAILEISQSDEYLNFKAYRALKESNQHFNINLFV